MEKNVTYKRSLAKELIFIGSLLLMFFFVLVAKINEHAKLYEVFFIAVCLLLSIAALVFILLTANYQLTPKHLSVRGINYGYWEDETIPYQDMLFIYQDSAENKVLFIIIVYWYNSRTMTMLLPAPSQRKNSKRNNKMIEELNTRMNETVTDHIISSDYLTRCSKSVVVAIASCLFVDELRLYPYTRFAIFNDGQRPILLMNCKAVKNETTDFASANQSQDEHLSCYVLEIAHIDNDLVKKTLTCQKNETNRSEIREIDYFVRNVYLLPKDIKEFRKLQNRSK